MLNESVNKLELLLVDDEEPFINLMCIALKKFDLGTHVANSGEKALEILKNTHIDILVTDLNMPGLSGVELMKVVNERYPEMIIIVITGHGGLEHAIEAMKYGAVDFLMKPVDFMAMRLSLEMARKKLELRRALHKANEDLKEKNEALRHLLGQHSKLHKVIEQSPISVVITDPLGIVEYVNPAFSTVTGYSSQEAMGQDISFIKSEKTPPSLHKQLWRTITQEQTWSGELQNKRKNGELYWEKMIAFPIVQDGRIINYVAIKEDATARKKMEKMLIDAKEEAEAANKAKSVFLANMSHEIRTPLNGIIGMTEILSESNLDKEQIDYANVISSSSELLLNIINDILDYSKIEAGELKLVKAPFNFEKIVNNIKDMYGARIDSNQIEFNVVYDENCPRNFLGDFMRLRQIILNLVSNAVKYTNRGEIEISVRSDEDESIDDYITVIIQVRDTGSGIPAEKQHTVFERFSQVEESYTRMHGGTGLGLAICKQLTILMGGTINLGSKVNEGTTVTLALPLLMDVDKESSYKQEQKNNETFETKRDYAEYAVLIVEDNPINQKMFSKRLELLGVNYNTADNGSEALERFKEKQYDLIFMDCQMPVLDGFATTRIIRDLEKGGRRTPVVAVTAYALPGDRDKCIQTGMDDYLPKPVRKKDVVKMLNKYLIR